MPRRLSLFASLLATLLLVLLPPTGTAVGAQEAPAAGAPRLVVFLVVDQMRADYIERFKGRWSGGFARLLREGAVFDNAEYPFMNTVTCAGHATIGTGTFPRTHGMILNAWWDRAANASTNCTDDSAAPALTYGHPSKTGNSAQRLLAPTLGDELRTQRPGGRVVTMSLKARSAIGLAGHAGDAVTWTDEGAVTFLTSRAFAEAPVASVAQFLMRDPFQADVRREWTLAAPEAGYRFPDSNPFARPPARGHSGLFPHRLAAKDEADAAFFTLWQTSPLSDAYLGRLAAAMVESFALGQRSEVDVLGVSFSALDLIGHAYGPESREVEDALIQLDATLGTLLDVLDARVGRGRYAVALTSDHGVAVIPQTVGASRIATEDIGERLEEALRPHPGAAAPAKRSVANVTFNNIYLADGVLNTLRSDEGAWRQAEQALLSLPGVDRVLRADQLDARSSDQAIRAAALSFRPDRSGDLIVIPKANWVIGPRADQAATTHGTAQPYDRRVPLVLFGAGVAAGHHVRVVTPADIAPTFAQMVGISLPRAEGHALHEALAKR